MLGQSSLWGPLGLSMYSRVRGWKVPVYQALGSSNSEKDHARMFGALGRDYLDCNTEFCAKRTELKLLYPASGMMATDI